jgi:Domain of unknown function (DUF4382)
MKRVWTKLLLSRGLGLIGLAAFLVGGQLAGGTAYAASGHVAVHLSNSNRGAAACRANDVDHVYVTIADVKAHRMGYGRGFSSLIGSPTPAQFDLMFASDESNEAIASADCPIVGVGGTGLPPGKYRQIRLITVADGTTDGGDPIIPPDENACAALGDTVYNCVDSGGSLFPLKIPGGRNTGLKIPPGQAGHGGLNIDSAQSVDLDIDIDACKALVRHGQKDGVNRKYSLKPTMRSGEIALNPVVSGQVVMGADNGPDTEVTRGSTPVPNATVWLEADVALNVMVGDPGTGEGSIQANALRATTTTDSNGNFTFCPVPLGNYDIVVDAESLPGGTNPANATITTGVAVIAGSGIGAMTIPLLEGSGPAVTLSQQVTTEAPSSVGSGDDIDFFATQGFGINDPINQAEVPPYSVISTQPQTTSASGCLSACPVGTNCVCFDVVMPSDNPVTGLVGGTYTSGSGPADYSLMADANVTASSTPACAPSQLITLSSTSPFSLPGLSFTECD